MQILRGSILSLILLCLTACSHWQTAPQWPAALSTCAAQLTALQQQAKQQGLDDKRYHFATGHPHLALDRFLIWLQPQAITPEQRREWLAIASDHARQQYQVWLHGWPANAPPPPATGDCVQQLTEYGASDPGWSALSHQPLVAPTPYGTWSRLLGLYPLTRWLVIPAVKRWHQQAKQRFNHKAAGFRHYQAYQLDRRGLYTPSPKVLLQAARQRSAFALPLLSPSEQQRLASHFAPALLIEQLTEDDTPGQPRRFNGTPGVDRSLAPLYYQVSYTVFQGEVLPQISYWVWFHARPKTAAIDLYGGPLDGLIWRVTLDAHGQPLLYDSIHPCGCYHQFFPVAQQLSPRPVSLWQEPALIHPPSNPGSRPTLAISSGEHQLIALRPEITAGEAVKPLTLRPYHELQRLEGASRSLFAPNGFVEGTERLEHWLLWPMGVPRTGAMRQWGQHATAFVGTRLFDDPQLLDKLFHWNSHQQQTPSSP